jgi:serine/threonine protein kinase
MVFLVQNLQDRQLYVLKAYTIEEKENFIHEVKVNETLACNSRKLVKMLDYRLYDFGQTPLFTFETAKIDLYSYLVLPYYPNGTLLDFLVKANAKGIKLSMNLQQYLFRQLVEAVAELRSCHGLSHLDIKPDNIILKDNFELALIDFAHASEYNRPSQEGRVCGTPAYQPAEVRFLARTSHQSYVPALVDAFNLGTTLFVIMFQNFPFHLTGDDSSELDAYFKLAFAHADAAKFFDRNYIPDTICEMGAEGRQIIWSCLDPVPCRRPSLRSLCQTQFVAGAPASVMEGGVALLREIAEIIQ